MDGATRSGMELGHVCGAGSVLLWPHDVGRSWTAWMSEHLCVSGHDLAQVLGAAQVCGLPIGSVPGVQTGFGDAGTLAGTIN
jgi:hypothetical protein